MRLTLSQKERLEELFKAVEILFNNEELGLRYSEITEAWLIGGVLRDVELFKNPPVGNYDFYIQIKKQDDILFWLKRLKENKIDYKVEKKLKYYNDDEVNSLISLSLLNLGIEYQINIFVGYVSPEEFLLNNYPVGISLIGLDMSTLFVSLNEKETVEKIMKKAWRAPAYKKDMKNKTITVLKQKWMTNKESYVNLEYYLEKIYHKLSEVDFH